MRVRALMMNFGSDHPVFRRMVGTKPEVFEKADEIGANRVKFAQRREDRDGCKEVLAFSKKDSEGWSLASREVLPLDDLVDGRILLD